MSRHGSNKPIRDAAPEWIGLLPREIEAKIVEMARDGVQSAVIGLRLRDQFGVPSVQEATGKKIGAIIGAANLHPKVPQDLTNLIQRAISLAEHCTKNRMDYHNKRGLEMMEARIRKLAKYYVSTNVLPADWRYRRAEARLLVD